MEIRESGEVEIRIDAEPRHVYEVISDVTRTGEWSPECRRCEWIDETLAGQVGARFRGWNRSGIVRWSRLVEVVASDPPREFGFRTVTDRFNQDSTSWRYRLAPDDGGTQLIHSYEVHTPPRFPVSWVMTLFLRHHADMRSQMSESLERIRTLAETGISETGRAIT